MSTFPPPVPKPAAAGASKAALANTAQAYANLRNGPGTQYQDIGDVYDNTLVAYYPATRTQDGWIWVEQYGVGGWITTSVVTFEDIGGGSQATPAPTPYDNQIALWHWRGDSISENSIEDVVKTLRTYAPNVKQLWVKTSDYAPSTGAQWMGYWDSKRSLAIDGPASIDRWVRTLAQNGLEFHAWCVPRGLDLVGETNLIIQACLRPGVKSMILDVEPYDGFWSGGKNGIRSYMLRIRKAIPGAFHIGMAVDPRRQHYATIFAEEWFPFVNSIHPMVYWEVFRRTPEDALKETYDVWGKYGRPIVPILQGDADVRDMRTAQTVATQRHGAKGVSWWRFGVIGPVEFPAVNTPITQTAPPPAIPPSEQYADEQMVTPQDSGFSIWSHTGQQESQSFQGTWGWRVYYKKTELQSSKVGARWSPRFAESGKYEISAFVPSRHSTTRNARYKIFGVKGATGETTVSLDQSKNSNQWVRLGVYEFDKNAINAGTVFMNDLTGESDKEIAFDAMRWRRLAPKPGTGSQISEGFDSPVGTAAERASSKVWPGKWFDASPFGKLYFIGTPSEAYHTGADLNLPSDADAHTPVYAAANGVVTFANRLPVWGNVVIIKHDPLTVGGTVMFGRYAHVESMNVTVGQRVTRGQQIAKVGNAYGRWAYHLHFDLSPTTILQTNPEHWPGKNRDLVFRHYIDPRQFIEQNRPKR